MNYSCTLEAVLVQALRAMLKHLAILKGNMGSTPVTKPTEQKPRSHESLPMITFKKT